MSVVNYFPPLDRGVLCQIFRHAGAFSNLAQVCPLFNEVVIEEAAKFYGSLTAMYGQGCVVYLLKRGGLGEDMSNAAKIDALFCTVLVSQKGEATPYICYNLHTLNDLKLYMAPYVLADALGKIWATLRRSGPSSLKALMATIKFGDDLLENAETIRCFFKDHAKELEKVDALNLNQKGLKVLPPEIRCFLQLKRLDLSGNSLTILPQEIGLLKELKDLRLNYNFLESLPEEICKLHSLENFQCASNRLQSIPEDLCQLSKLRTLNLSRNRITALPETIHGLQALNYLYLESNALNSLPESIGSIPYLIGLYLFSNQLAALPDSICNMGHLKYLSAQNNALTALPENLGDLESLTSLLLDSNKIQELTSSLCALKNLKHFFFSCNQMEIFPEWMKDMKKLELVCFSGNPIKVVSGPLNSSLAEAEFNRVYWGLGRDNKWKEFIDGYDHVHGPDVYDKGLHGRSVEPGFRSSLFKACEFLSAHPNQRIDADFYLQLHKEACGHFKGKDTCTLMGQEKVGVFRDSDDAISAGFSEKWYFMTECAINEFLELNMKISLILGSSFRIGDIVPSSSNPNSKTIHYFTLSREQVKIIFNFFLTEFYHDLGRAKGEHDTVQAIAKLIQRLEWLHPVRDGCGRTDSALLNYLLTSCGFNPVLFDLPYVSSCKGLDEWTSLVFKGMQKWREEAGL